MRFFRKAKKREGWLAIALQRDGLVAVSMQTAPDIKPQVRQAVFYPGKSAAELLEKAGRELHAHAYRSITVLNAGEYQILSVDAPNVAPDELKTAVRWRLKDMLDFHVDDATIDVLDLPVDPNAAVRAQHSMFAIAARNSVIEARQKMFTSAKVELAVIDIPEMAQRNISALVEPPGRGVAMLSFRDEGGLLTVSWRGELYLARRIDLGLDQLLDDDIERRNGAFDRVTLELQRSLDNFERQYSFISVAKLVLAPSPVVGLDEYLSSNLYTPVDTLDLASLFDFERTPELADKLLQQRFLVPLGAALRHEETVL
ncbi:type IV pilus biogenesis protein PilM [Massilia litorea]|uniref:Agglutinin biogenesis protein MshI n=1 Tax=Massilia litorea TaxID=2769491 RepID=A0A7L9U243_9BURK|nr:agglutinin biogenesis protein MshI [Massilia litorea]QOL49103.1 agglutinin biogenesis protein MshI [Massilia litorea]